jgi:hypothetical protein
MLAANQLSMAVQTSGDWIQVVHRDAAGRGVDWANGQMATIAGHLTGDYIWILDDDDECIDELFVATLKRVASQHNPDVIMVKMDHGIYGILPDVASWGLEPIKAHIGCSAYVVRREVWQRYAHAWQGANYSSDFDFISAIFDDTSLVIYWLDLVASRVQQIGSGEPEYG